VLTEDLPEVRAAVDSLPAPSAASPERHYRRVEMLRLIQVALDRLPAKYGDVLEWKYIEGYSVREISTRLDISTEATQSLLARAKRAFSQVYSTMTAGLELLDNEWVNV
jgi:RNA polymerase sigma-70 factor (ECF subfamily)